MASQDVCLTMVSNWCNTAHDMDLSSFSDFTLSLLVPAFPLLSPTFSLPLPSATSQTYV